MIDDYRRFIYLLLAGVFAAALAATPVFADKESGESRSTFLTEALGGGVSDSAKTLWLNKELKQQLNDLFSYQVNALRIRYWLNRDTSVWILDEVGKEQPITIGLVINANGIKKIEVLEYRESRGGEIQYPFFTQQFSHAGLYTENSQHTLDKQIDGITGATLSVRAMIKVAKVALFFHQKVTEPPVNNEYGSKS